MKLSLKSNLLSFLTNVINDDTNNLIDLVINALLILFISYASFQSLFVFRNAGNSLKYIDIAFSDHRRPEKTEAYQLSTQN